MSDADRNNPSENEIESPVDGPTPDWMRMATSSSSTPSLSEEDTPDWLKAIRSGKSTAELQPKEAEEDPHAGMSDLERLLAEEGIDLNAVPEERPEGAAGMSVRDWMISTSEDEMIRKRVGAEPIEEEPGSLPKEAEEDPYAGMSDLERLLAEEGIDLNAVPEERPEGAAGMSVRDWMISTSEDELIRKRVGAEAELEETDFDVVPVAENDRMVVEEDLPDWLRDVEEEAAAEPILASAGSEMAVAEEDLPDWLRDAEEEPAVAEFGQDEDLPDWLRDVEEEVETLLEPVVAEDDKMVVEEDLPDWLQGGDEEEEPLVEPVTAASAAPDNLVVEEDLPDWLRGIEEEPVAVTPAPTLSTDNLMQEEDLPDWLRGVREEEPEPAPLGSTAAFVEDEEDFAFGEEEEGLPDWLKKVQDEAEKEPALSATPTLLSQEAVDFSDEDLPDWLREVQDEELEPETAASAKPLETDLPGWLKGTEEEEFVDEDETLVIEEELPDWLSEAQPQVEDEPFEPSEPSPEEPARELEEDLPDWLREVEAEEVPVEALPTQFAREDLAEPVSPEGQPVPVGADAISVVEESELPDWLREVEKGAEEEAPAELPEAVAAEVEVEEEGLPDWLTEAEEEAPAELPEAVVAKVEVEEEGLPDWLTEAEEEAPAELPEAVAAEVEVEEEGLPDWLTEAEEEAPAELPEAVAAKVEVEEEGLPDWLTEVEAETPMGLPEPVTAEVEVEEEGLPDWLIGVEAETPMGLSESVAAEVEVEEAEEVGPEPAIAAPVGVEEALPEAEPVSRVTAPQPVGEMPDWLKKLREGHEETAPLPQPVAYVQPVIMAATPEPVAAAPVTPQAKLPAEPDKLLELARTARTRGNIKEAAPLYDTLITSGAHLDSVIEDMRQSVKADPSNYLLYQIMGDAMMKDGRLQNALEAYRQALGVLSK